MRPGGGLGRESVGNGTVTSVPLLTEKHVMARELANFNE